MGAANQSEPKPEKVRLVLTVPTQNAQRGEKVTVDRDLADQLIANQQAHEA